jgi:hypothetical protein
VDTTQQLAQLITRITPWKYRPQTLSRCFQALRIVVNDEINSLEETLNAIHRVLRPRGRLVVISYHSLEDRRVKNLFRFGNVQGEAEATFTPMNLFSNAVAGRNSIWNPLFKKALAPSSEEVEANSRSRSAKLRVAERVHESSNNSEEGDVIAGHYKKRRSSSSSPTTAGAAAPMGAKQLAKLLKQKEPLLSPPLPHELDKASSGHDRNGAALK